MSDATTPTEDGFYWWRESAYHPWTIVSVYTDRGRQLVSRFVHEATDVDYIEQLGSEYRHHHWGPRIVQDATSDMLIQLLDVLRCHEDDGADAPRDGVVQTVSIAKDSTPFIDGPIGPPCDCPACSTARRIRERLGIIQPPATC